MGLKAALAKFRELQEKYASYGASDTEPDAALCWYLADVLEGGDTEAPCGWDIFDQMKGAEDVNAELTEAAEEIGEYVQRLRRKLIWLQNELWRVPLEWPEPKKGESQSACVTGRAADRPTYTVSMPAQYALGFGPALKRLDTKLEPKMSSDGDCVEVTMRGTIASVHRAVLTLSAIMEVNPNAFSVEVNFGGA